MPEEVAAPSTTSDQQGSKSEYQGALAGLRILDLSRFIAGPLCAQLLGDMGAQVIKVERPGGEDARSMEPTVGGQSLYVMSYNRNKLGVTLDTRQAQAQDVLERLVRKSDVLVENYRPGTLDAMGLTTQRLKELNPSLVVTSLSGFGQSGPMTNRALFDPIAQAMSGLMSLTGGPDSPPTMSGAFMADYLTGVYGALGTVMALFHRQVTGTGQVVDVGSLDVMFSALGIAPSEFMNNGTVPVKTGSRDKLSGPANVFKATDGWIFVHAGTDPLFRRLTRIMNRPELAEGEWSTVKGRMEDIEAVEKTVAEWVGSQESIAVQAKLEIAGIPFGPVLGIPEVVGLPQLWAREMIVDVAHTSAGAVRLPGIPMKLSGSPGRIRHGAPDVGEHNDFVYGEVLGYSTEEINSLRAGDVI